MQDLRDRAEAALDKGAAIMVTEWGTSEATGDGHLNAAETARWLDFMGKNHLSWCNWSVMDKRETSAALTSAAPRRRRLGARSAHAVRPTGPRRDPHAERPIAVKVELKSCGLFSAPAPFPGSFKWWTFDALSDEELD